MDILPVKIFGSPVLRKTAGPVSEITDELLKLIEDMKNSLYYHQGIGLAANQVGVSKRLFLADDGNDLRVFINPSIIEADGEAVSEEGCLSLPDIFIDITRSSSLLLEYMDMKGEIRRQEADGLLARVIQHEYDHLEGVLISDRAGFMASRLIKGKLKKLKKRVQESL